MPELAPEVRDWEPHLALSPGGDGLDAYRAIARGAGARLMPGGRLLVEIGPTQGPAVAALFAAAGLDGIRVLPDLDGRDRVVVAVKSGAADSCGCA
jgi:release factor glutamine methyltransferase